MERGYSEIEFIQAGPEKTPDLRAERGTSRAILEVKSINRSDEELDRLALGQVEARDVLFGLSELFRKKLCSTISSAKRQLDAYPGRGATPIILLVVRWDIDYMLNHDNNAELAAFLAPLSTASCEIVHQIAY